MTMRLFERVLRNGVNDASLPLRAGDPVRTHGVKRFTLDELPLIRVTADDVFDMFWRAEDDHAFTWAKLGPLRAPYDEMWIEGALPPTVHADGTVYESPYAYHGAVVWGNARAEQLMDQFRPMVTSIGGENPSPGEADQTADQYLIIVPCLGFRDGPNLLMRERVHVGLSEDGSYLWHTIVYPEGVMPARVDQVASTVLPIALSLALMCCRNVRLVESGPTRKRKKQTRPRAELRYSKVELPALRGAGDPVAAAGAPAALHLVRGHFKTYTNDAPLLGQHVGTWWWGWQARGEKARGVVIPQYEVSQ